MQQIMRKEKELVEIPVVYATDHNYLFYTCVSITSLAEHAAESTFYKIYILVGEEFCDEENLLCALNDRYSNLQIAFICMETEVFDHVFIQNEHISKAAFYRLAICDFISEDKCIYLDSDTLITEDLQELIDYDIETYYLAGCRDIWIDCLSEEACEKRRIETRIPSMKGYVNSGVLVFNLKKIREDRLNESFIAHMNIRYPYEDQDILNICCYNHIFMLPVKWNNFTAGIGLEKDLRAAGIKEDVLQVFKTFCGITHYATKEARPWEGCLAWKNWHWWQMAEKWSNTKAYQYAFWTLTKKDNQKSWRELLKEIQGYQAVTIWGYTPYAMELCDWLLLTQMGLKICFCDSDKEKIGQVYKMMKVLSPEQAIQTNEEGIYLIASQRQGEQIRAELLNHGTLPENILLYKRKDITFYRMLDSRYYEQELDELFLKEAIKIPPKQRMQELLRHEEWVEKYYLKWWILKTE